MPHQHHRLLLWAVSWLVVINLVVIVQARLEAAVLLPHGDFAWDPFLTDFLVHDDNGEHPNDDAKKNNENDERTDQQRQQYVDTAKEAAREIAQAARQAGSWLWKTSRPTDKTQSRPNHNHSQQQQQQHDVILVVSPHGVALQHDFGLWLDSDWAAGSVTLGQDLPSNSNQNAAFTYQVALNDIRLNATLAHDLWDFLTRTTTNRAKPNVTGVYLTPDGTNPAPMYWGEVIPLLFIPRENDDGATTCQEQQQQPPQRSHIIWSMPRRRLGPAAGTDMMPELLQLGADLRRWMDQSQFTGIRFAVVISGDLAHTHRADGPYGYAADAPKLDEALGKWASGGGNNGRMCSDAGTRALLHDAARWQPKGLSCGFTGMVLLQGMLCGNGSDDENSSDTRTTQQQHDNNNMVATKQSNSPRAFLPRQRGAQESFIRRSSSTTTTTATTTSMSDQRNQKENNNNNNNNWKSKVLVNRNVTYYGMMVAQFWLDDDDDDTWSATAN